RTNVHRMLGIDVSTEAVEFLRFGNDLERQRRLAGGFGAVDFHDSATRYAANAESDIESEGSGRDHRGVFDHAPLAELHDRTFAKLPFNLAYSQVNRLLPIPIHLLPPSHAALQRYCLKRGVTCSLGFGDAPKSDSLVDVGTTNSVMLP